MWRCGEGADGVAVGDKVAYAGPMGSYAELAAVPADRVVSLPDGVSCEVGAAAMIQGITAHYLAHGSVPAQGYGYGPNSRWCWGRGSSAYSDGQDVRRAGLDYGIHG